VFDSTDPITGADCPYYGGLATISSAIGTALHLGRIDLEAAHCTPLADEPITGEMTPGGSQR
jgi:hypothetical protein